MFVIWNSIISFYMEQGNNSLLVLRGVPIQGSSGKIDLLFWGDFLAPQCALSVIMSKMSILEFIRKNQPDLLLNQCYALISLSLDFHYKILNFNKYLFYSRSDVFENISALLSPKKKSRHIFDVSRDRAWANCPYF